MGHVHLNTKNADNAKEVLGRCYRPVDIMAQKKTKLAFMQAFKLPAF